MAGQFDDVDVSLNLNRFIRPIEEVKEFHQQGYLTLENFKRLFPTNGHSFERSFEGDVGLQVSDDGRIWLCLDGIAFIRFTPHPNRKMSRD